MQLVINTYGSYLRKKGNCFLVRKEDKVFEVSVTKVDSILIATAAYISTDAIKFAVDNNKTSYFSILMENLMEGCGIPSWAVRH